MLKKVVTLEELLAAAQSARRKGNVPKKLDFLLEGNVPADARIEQAFHEIMEELHYQTGIESVPADIFASMIMSRLSPTSKKNMIQVSRTARTVAKDITIPASVFFESRALIEDQIYGYGLKAMMYPKKRFDFSERVSYKDGKFVTLGAYLALKKPDALTPLVESGLFDGTYTLDVSPMKFKVALYYSLFQYKESNIQGSAFGILLMHQTETALLNALRILNDTSIPLSKLYAADGRQENRSFAFGHVWPGNTLPPKYMDLTEMVFEFKKMSAIRTDAYDARAAEVQKKIIIKLMDRGYKVKKEDLPPFTFEKIPELEKYFE